MFRSSRVSLLFCICMTPALATAPAQLAVRNAKIVTEDASRSLADSFAVTSGRFVAVGRNSDIQRYVGPRTRIVDAGGSMVLPGLSSMRTSIRAMGSTMVIAATCAMSQSISPR